MALSLKDMGPSMRTLVASSWRHDPIAFNTCRGYSSIPLTYQNLARSRWFAPLNNTPVVTERYPLPHAHHPPSYRQCPRSGYDLHDLRYLKTSLHSHFSIQTVASCLRFTFDISLLGSCRVTRCNVSKSVSTLQTSVVSIAIQ